MNIKLQLQINIVDFLKNYCKLNNTHINNKLKMIWHYINLLFSWTNINRWNNFPRIENISETDNLSMVLHTVMVVEEILIENESVNIDIHYIFKKIIIKSFVKFIISDIDYNVKKKIIQKNPELFSKIENQAINILKSFEAPNEIINDIHTIYYDNKVNNEKSIENLVIDFSKLMVARIEVYFNKWVYWIYYDNVLSEIDKKLTSKKFLTLTKFFDINNYEEWYLRYLIEIRRLQFNYRWNKLRKIYKISVMSHTYVVFFLSYVIWIVEWKSDSEKVEMMKIALYHDISESITWDIVTVTKKMVEWFEELIQEVEISMIEKKLLKYIDNYEFSKNIKKYILNPWESDLWKLVKIADIFSALFEIRSEKDKDINKIYSNIKKVLIKYEYKSVDYLLRYWVEYFDDNVDDYIKIFIKNNKI